MLIIYALLTFCVREQAQSYIYDPSRVDTKRGLKRSWTRSKKSGDAAGSNTQNTKPTAAEKGMH